MRPTMDKHSMRLLARRGAAWRQDCGLRASPHLCTGHQTQWGAIAPLIAQYSGLLGKDQGRSGVRSIPPTDGGGPARVFGCASSQDCAITLDGDCPGLAACKTIPYQNGACGRAEVAKRCGELPEGTDFSKLMLRHTGEGGSNAGSSTSPDATKKDDG